MKYISGADGVDPAVTGWTTALYQNLINIFGDGSVSKNVYIQFELAAFAPVVPDGFTAIPGSSPSYITVQYNQELGSAPNKLNFSIENQTKMLPMDISGINIITTSIYNDTLELEFDADDIDPLDIIEYTYSTTTIPYITNLAGTQAPNVSMEHITANPPPITDPNFFEDVSCMVRRWCITLWRYFIWRCITRAQIWQLHSLN